MCEGCRGITINIFPPDILSCCTVGKFLIDLILILRDLILFVHLDTVTFSWGGGRSWSCRRVSLYRPPQPLVSVRVLMNPSGIPIFYTRKLILKTLVVRWGEGNRGLVHRRHHGFVSFVL